MQVEKERKYTFNTPDVWKSGGPKFAEKSTKRNKVVFTLFALFLNNAIIEKDFGQRIKKVLLFYLYPRFNTNSEFECRKPSDLPAIVSVFGH